MNKLGFVVIFLTIVSLIFASCGTPRITTKVVEGQSILDTILGFRLGMTPGEAHQVATGRGMVKKEALSSAWKACYFWSGTFWLFTGKRVNLGWVREDAAEGCNYIHVSLKPTIRNFRDLKEDDRRIYFRDLC